MGEQLTMEAIQLKRFPEVLREIPADKREHIAKALCSELIGKGLSFGQAEALLDYAKTLLKNAKI